MDGLAILDKLVGSMKGFAVIELDVSGRDASTLEHRHDLYSKDRHLTNESPLCSTCSATEDD